VLDHLGARPRLRGLLVGASALALLATVAGTVQAAQRPPATTSSDAPLRLQTGGGYFRDAQGRVVILHGFNLNGSDFPNDTLSPFGFTEKDADFLAASGFNFLRLGVDWSKLAPAERPKTPDRFMVNQAALDKIARVAELLASRQIYFMIDFHQGCFHEWPEWAIPYDKVVGRATDNRAFPHCHLVPSGNTRAYDNLFKYPDPDNPALPGGSSAVIPVAEVWAYYREAWRVVAERFRNTDYLLGYDFINEPGTSHLLQCLIPVVGCPHAEEKIQAFEENALAGIRDADPVSTADPAGNARAGIGVFEPPNVAGTSGAPTGLGNTPVTDPKVAWSFHVYCGNFEQPVPGTHTCRHLMRPAFQGTAGVGGSARNAAHLTGADRHPDREPAPQLMGEFGSTTDPTVIQDTLDHADPRFISWAYWQYKGWDDAWRVGIFANKADEECVCFNTHSPRADALIRPYAQGTAGTPVSYSYDVTSRVMTYTYKPMTDRSLSTEIVVPAYYAPRGYDVSVTNGQIVSLPDALHLKVLPISHRNVTVRVKPD
jgi:endoglycosylceramidase